MVVQPVHRHTGPLPERGSTRPDPPSPRGLDRNSTSLLQAAHPAAAESEQIEGKMRVPRGAESGAKTLLPEPHTSADPPPRHGSARTDQPGTRALDRNSTTQPEGARLAEARPEQAKLTAYEGQSFALGARVSLPEPHTSLDPPGLDRNNMALPEGTSLV